MTGENVVAAISGAGMPICHMAWPAGSAPKLPWCVFYLNEDETLYADDAPYADRAEWCVELYCKPDDADSAPKVERALREGFGNFTKSEAWVEDQGCLQTSYVFDEIR